MLVFQKSVGAPRCVVRCVVECGASVLGLVLSGAQFVLGLVLGALAGD